MKEYLPVEISKIGNIAGESSIYQLYDLREKSAKSPDYKFQYFFLFHSKNLSNITANSQNQPPSAHHLLTYLLTSFTYLPTTKIHQPLPPISLYQFPQYGKPSSAFSAIILSSSANSSKNRITIKEKRNIRTRRSSSQDGRAMVYVGFSGGDGDDDDDNGVRDAVGGGGSD